MTKIYLIRHAEAEGNIFRRAHGHYNGLITKNGDLQIEKLRKRFEGVDINAVFSSDLSRTCTTVMAFSEPRNLQIHTSPMLREVNVGIWEDISWGDVEYQYLDMYNNFTYDPDKWDIEGGEEYEAIKNRMYDIICEKAELHAGETIAMFSHGFVIRALISKLNNIPSHRTREVPYCDNTAVALLNYENGKLEIEYHGDNSHLTDDVSTLAKQTWWRKGDGAKHSSNNLRFVPFDEVADDELMRKLHAESGEQTQFDVKYVAFRVNDPVGIVELDTKQDESENVGWLRRLYVTLSGRNATYGTQLLGAAISEFRKLRREKMRVEVPVNSPGINLLNKHGFYTLDVNDEVCLMEKDIKNW